MGLKATILQTELGYNSVAQSVALVSLLTTEESLYKSSEPSRAHWFLCYFHKCSAVEALAIKL